MSPQSDDFLPANKKTSRYKRMQHFLMSPSHFRIIMKNDKSVTLVLVDATPGESRGTARSIYQQCCRTFRTFVIMVAQRLQLIRNTILLVLTLLQHMFRFRKNV